MAVGAGLICLLASLLIGTRRRDGAGRLRPQKPLQTTSATVLLALMAIGSSAQASPQSAEQAYKKGDYSGAEKQYEQAAAQNPETAPLQFDLGAAPYKTGEYDKALPAFQKALDTDQVGVQQQAYYNIGNTQYRLGQKTEKTSPQDTIKTWQDAVQSYNAALKLKPDDADAKFNRDFVQKKLDELQKQQPPQQQKQDQQNQQDQKQDQQNQQQQSGSAAKSAEPEARSTEPAKQPGESAKPKSIAGQPGQFTGSKAIRLSAESGPKRKPAEPIRATKPAKRPAIGTAADRRQPGPAIAGQRSRPAKAKWRRSKFPTGPE